ncbi:MAG: hypothetical protein KIT72_17035 [Polyangiaceae bacterium]|nr:hypothetical protein [Polyangiaceae bacterium]MCW5792125.1 hypothetical protein [Polyangiaceae bacterium]
MGVPFKVIVANKPGKEKSDKRAEWYQHIGAGLGLALALLIGWALWAAVIESWKEGLGAVFMSLVIALVVSFLALGVVAATLGVWAEAALTRLLSLASGELHQDIAEEGRRAWPKDLAAWLFYVPVGGLLVVFASTPTMTLLGLSSLALAGFAFTSMILSAWVSARGRDTRRPRGDSSRIREGAGIASWVVMTSVTSLMVGGAIFEELPGVRDHGEPAQLYEGRSIDFCIGQVAGCEVPPKVVYFTVPRARSVELVSSRGDFSGKPPILLERRPGAREERPPITQWRRADSDWRLTLQAEPGVRYELVVEEARYHRVTWEASP